VRCFHATFFLVGALAHMLADGRVEAAPRDAGKRAGLELRLTGPAPVGLPDSLEEKDFKATLTNHSPTPMVFLARNGALMNAIWDWTITDVKRNRVVGMDLRYRLYCATPPTGEENPESLVPLHDADIFVLEPGESHEFSITGDSLFRYAFPRADTYLCSVTLTYVAPNSGEFVDEAGVRWTERHWDFSNLTTEKREALQSSRGLKAASDKWKVALGAASAPTPGMPLNPSLLPLFKNLPVIPHSPQ
jgi:hypothetical protein